MNPSMTANPVAIHAEDAGGSIAVNEVAAGRRVRTADEEHGRDRDRGDDEDDDAGEEQVHVRDSLGLSASETTRSDARVASVGCYAIVSARARALGYPDRRRR